MSYKNSYLETMSVLESVSNDLTRIHSNMGVLSDLFFELEGNTAEQSERIIRQIMHLFESINREVATLDLETIESIEGICHNRSESIEE